MENNNEKKTSKKKEFLMIILVVVLAFGLTVTGIIYLTKFLLGEDSTPATAQQTQPMEDNDSVVRFSLDNETGQPIDVPSPTAPITPPPADVPQPPQATTPQAGTPPPATTTAVTPPPAATPPPAVTPTPAVTPPARPQTPPPATTAVPGSSPASGKYQLQLYAFRSQATAEAEARKLQGTYPDIFVMRADLGANGIWYRVRCCSMDTKEDAEKVKAEIERKYKITPYIVNR